MPLLGNFDTLLFATHSHLHMEAVMGDLGWTMRQRLATQTRTGLQARDLIWLAALGLGLREAFDLEKLSQAIDEAAGRIWTPVLDVMADCLEEMARAGLLGLSDEGFVTTAQGRQSMSMLMALPQGGPAGCPLGQVCLRLKMSFLDLIPLAERKQHLGPIIDACQGELSECRRRCALCSTQGSFARHWLRTEEEKLLRDLGLLLSLLGQAMVPSSSGLS